MKKRCFNLALLPLFLLTSCGNEQPDLGPEDPPQELIAPEIVPGNNYTYDIVVYGATSAGAMAAVSAKREGANVCLVAPESYVGGMTTSGVMHGDLPEEGALGSLTKEFYQKLYKHYAISDNWLYGVTRDYFINHNTGWPGSQGERGYDEATKTWWEHEPHVAEQIFKNLLFKYGVPVYLNCPIDLNNGVVYDETTQQIKQIRLVDSTTFTAKVFLDATYEGDLMAQSHVTYTIGREDNRTYDETYNGIRTGASYKIDGFNIDGDPDSGLMMFFEEKHPGNNGTADGRVQSYGYRFVTTDKVENMVPFIKPANYRPEWFEWLGRAFKNGYNSSWPDHYLLDDPLPNGKYDVNQVDVPYICSDYVFSSWEERKEIDNFYRDYTLGMMWFLQNDSRVPTGVQNYWKSMGLAKDEYQSNGYFPYGLYIREGRRMVSDYVMTQHDVLRESEGGGKYAPQSICAGMYNADSHIVTRYYNSADNTVHYEGGYWSNTSRVYPIAYRSIVPAKGECTNLVVPCCVSASHAAIASIRIEPTYMAIGESSGIAAYLAFKNNTSVQDVDYITLKNKLLSYGQVLANGYKNTFDESDKVVPYTDFDDEARTVITVNNDGYSDKGTVKKTSDSSYSYDGAIAHITNTVGSGGVFEIDQSISSGRELKIEVGDLYHSSYDDSQYAVTITFNNNTRKDVMFAPKANERNDFSKGKKNIKFFDIGKYQDVKSVQITKTENTDKYIRICAIAVTPLGGEVVPSEPVEGAINIPDKNLKRILVKAAGSTNNEVTLEQLQNITTLEKDSADPKKQIRDLTGIENCINLTKLDLSYQKIKDISPIKNLTKLEEITLSYNPIKNIDEIKTLTSLKKLVVIGIEDTKTSYNFLSNLVNLTFLNVCTCRITDASFLSALTKLERCYMVFNDVENKDQLPNYVKF